MNVSIKISQQKWQLLIKECQKIVTLKENMTAYRQWTQELRGILNTMDPLFQAIKKEYQQAQKITQDTPVLGKKLDALLQTTKDIHSAILVLLKKIPSIPHQ